MRPTATVRDRAGGVALCLAHWGIDSGGSEGVSTEARVAILKCHERAASTLSRLSGQWPPLKKTTPFVEEAFPFYSNKKASQLVS